MQPADVLRACRADEVQVLRQLAAHVGLGEAHADTGTDREGPHHAGIGDDGEFEHGLGRVADGALAFLDAQHATGDGRARALYLDACAAQRVQQAGGGRVRAERKAECSQPLLERRHRIEGDARHLAVAQVGGGERLQHVVQLAAGQVDRDRLVAADASHVLEVPDPGLVEDDASHR